MLWTTNVVELFPSLKCLKDTQALLDLKIVLHEYENQLLCAVLVWRSLILIMETNCNQKFLVFRTFYWFSQICVSVENLPSCLLLPALDFQLGGSWLVYLYQTCVSTCPVLVLDFCILCTRPASVPNYWICIFLSLLPTYRYILQTVL